MHGRDAVTWPVPRITVGRLGHAWTVFTIIITTDRWRHTSIPCRTTIAPDLIVYPGYSTLETPQLQTDLLIAKLELIRKVPVFHSFPMKHPSHSSTGFSPALRAQFTPFQVIEGYFSRYGSPTLLQQVIELSSLTLQVRVSLLR